MKVFNAEIADMFLDLENLNRTQMVIIRLYQQGT